jgi:hypothetical protein
MLTNDTVRTSDNERDQTVAALSDHFALGRLSLDELNRRVEQALRATTRGELFAVVADLPMRQPSTPDRRTGGPRAGSPSGTWVWAMWAPWMLTGLICLVVWLATSVAHGAFLYFWPLWVIGPWGAALGGLSVLGSREAVLGGHRRPGAGRCRL